MMLSACQRFDSSIPEGWALEPIGKRIAMEYGAGLTDAERTPGSYQVFGSNGPVGTHDKYLVEGPGILVGRKGSVGEVHFSEANFWPIDTVYYVTRKAGDDLRFVACLLEFLRLDNLNAATGVPGLTRRDALFMLGAFPPIAEQTRIAETLKAADDHIRALEEQIRKAEQVKKALLLAAFPAYAKGSSPPAGFCSKSLRHLVASWANGLYVPDSDYGSGVPIIRIDTFEDGYFYSREFKRVRIDETDRNRFAVLEGDVLLNRVNSHPFLGKVVFVDRLDEPTVFESNMMRLHFLSRVVAQWTALALSSPAYKRVIWALGRPAVGQLSINQREVGQIHLVVPDTEAQMQDAIEQIGAARKYVEALNHQLTAARRVKQSLLQNLLAGKIRLKP